ncbi:MAG: universal stress protein [Mariprofundaceae bacterium]
MLTISRIVAPTDFSASSEYAVQIGLEVAQRFEAELHLLHVVNPQVYYADMPELTLIPLEHLSEELIKSGMEKLQAAADELAAKKGSARIQVHQLESAQRPATAISEFAAELPADLIIIGSHGDTGLVHALLGSTAERIVREAPCPVLVTKLGAIPAT